MFEGKPPQPQLAKPDEAEAEAPDDLRLLTWSDLRERLDAARELRAAMMSKTEERLASFDAHSASRIAAQTDGKEAVNPDNLGNGKGPGFKNDAASASDGDCGSEPGN